MPPVIPGPKGSNGIKSFLADRMLSTAGFGIAGGTAGVSCILCYYQIGAGSGAFNTLKVKAGTTNFVVPVGTIPADQWGLFAQFIDAAGNFTLTPAAATYTVGYPSEAAAIAALPATPANQAFMGFYTVKTAVGLPWIGLTDGLVGTGTGNAASQTNLYNAGPTA